MNTRIFEVNGISFEFDMSVSREETLKQIEEEKELYRRIFTNIVTIPLTSFAENLSIEKNSAEEDKRFLGEMAETIRKFQDRYEFLAKKRTCAEKLLY